MVHKSKFAGGLLEVVQQIFADVCKVFVKLYTLALKGEGIWHGCTRKADQRKRSVAPDGQ